MLELELTLSDDPPNFPELEENDEKLAVVAFDDDDVDVAGDEHGELG